MPFKNAYILTLTIIIAIIAKSLKLETSTANFNKKEATFTNQSKFRNWSLRLKSKN